MSQSPLPKKFQESLKKNFFCYTIKDSGGILLDEYIRGNSNIRILAIKEMKSLEMLLSASSPKDEKYAAAFSSFRERITSGLQDMFRTDDDLQKYYNYLMIHINPSYQELRNITP